MFESDNKPGPRHPQVSVIIPARNEEVCIGACLESLVAQSGTTFEILVVDDHSTDRTREIAASFPRVRVIDVGSLPAGWTGKNNAVAAGAREALGEWLLFTDADTVHLPGSMARALWEAKEHSVDMLSYSPEQIAVTFWEMATLPVVFAELARQYPPGRVSDPNSPDAAANGQYILISRSVYDAVRGHEAVAFDILEDVALARMVKASGREIRFRYGNDAVRTRMYRSFRQLREGWTKNLALLFPAPGWLATKTMILWAFPWAVLFCALTFDSQATRHWWWLAIAGIGVTRNTMRLQRANFDLTMEFLGAFFGMPMFAYLLLRSKRVHGKGSVAWKGRTYRHHDPEIKPTAAQVRITPAKTLMKMPLVLILPALLIATMNSRLDAQPTLPATGETQSSIELSPRFTNTVIEPGLGVGPLKMGDSRDRALVVFPRNDRDQEAEDQCGTTLDWVDVTNPMGRGDVFIRIKKDKVFQIESATTRFQTAEGITTFDPPEKVASAYKNLRAYVLLTALTHDLGDRPLVFWVDKKKGIAFSFAYDVPRRKRYVYKVIVFEPNKNFCPEQETTKSLRWQEIPAYAVEPPKELSPER